MAGAMRAFLVWVFEVLLWSTLVVLWLIAFC